MAVYIAAHEHCDLVVPDGYQPLFVGVSRHTGIVRHAGWLYDDMGSDDSISAKNDTFCEMTGLYWAWRNDVDDIVGLVHYRRYFVDPSTGAPLQADAMRRLLLDHDAIVAERQVFERGGSLLSSAEQYRLVHSSLDLRMLRDVIRRRFRGYLDAFDACMVRPWLYPCNMLICCRELLDEYCRFAFSVLAACEHAIDPYAHRDAYQRRVFGFLAERLLNVFLLKHGIDAVELPYANPNGEAVEAPGHAEPPCAHLPMKVPLDAFTPVHDGVDYSPIYDARFYLAHYDDVHGAVGDDPERGYYHFLEFGLAEGRQAHPKFSIASFRNAHPELAVACGDDAHAWCRQYLQVRRRDLFAFGAENLSFEDDASRPAGEGGRRVDISGRVIRPGQLKRAAKRAARQGVID